MRRLIDAVGFGLSVAVFAVVCLFASPLILFKFGVDWVRERIESRWPDSERAREISSWIGLLAPVLFVVVLAVTLWGVVFHVKNIADANHAPALGSLPVALPNSAVAAASPRAGS